MRRLFLLLPVLAATQAAAQQTQVHRPAAVTAEDYARAEKYLGQSMTPLVVGGAVQPQWLPDGRFWYRSQGTTGTRIVIVDPAKRTRTDAFDHPRLATALAQASGGTVDAANLPVQAFTDDATSVAFQVGQGRFSCDLRTYRCLTQQGQADAQAQAAGGRGGRGGRGGGPAGDPNTVLSHDGKMGAFVRTHNLWMREVATGRETQLTTDGIDEFAYATNNAGWTRSDRPVLVWSPDSKKIATFQQDSRGVKLEHLVSTNVGHTRIESWKYPFAGDSMIFMLHRVIIDVSTPSPRVVKLQMPPDAQRSTICDHIVCGGQWTDIEWTQDASKLAFVSSTRNHQRATLRIADPATGAIRDVIDEKVATFFESGRTSPGWRVLAETNEAIWFSQRDDWGHLYLYDLTTGQVKNQITKGDWNVLTVVNVDRVKRQVTFIGDEREPGDPYFQYLYRVNFDGTGLKLLTPDSANHSASFSPDRKYIIDTYSTPTIPPVSVLRDAEGRKLVELERADISKLVAAKWQAPIPITVKARDGKTDLYGLMYRPSNFDPLKKYPIINHIYPGPQTGSVGSRSFSAARGDVQAMAELGFIVVQIDAMGTPGRSKSFHAAYYGNMGDNGLPDQIAGMRELAQRHSWIDLDRVGINGHSGGGFASTAAILRYPDFFKVAVSQAGNHDNRNYEDDWGEKWQGLLEGNNYDNQANQLLAKNLKGKLLIAHGTMDNNVPPSNTLLVADALIAANKDFDLLMMPNRRHGFGSEPYMMRRRWDYFVKHLLGSEPPKEFQFGRPVS